LEQNLGFELLGRLAPLIARSVFFNFPLDKSELFNYPCQAASFQYKIRVQKGMSSTNYDLSGEEEAHIKKEELR
jgi:hypothetical protein